MVNIRKYLLSLILSLIPCGVASASQDGADNIANYLDLPSAVTAIGESERTLAIPYPISLNVDLVIPTSLRLRFVNSGRIDVGTGKMLTIKSSGEDWPVAQLFGGEGIVSFAGGRASFLRPEWWGAKADGISDDILPLQRCANAALTLGTLNGGLIKLLPRTYRITDTWKINNQNDDPSYSITSRISIEGAGRYLTRIEYEGTGDAVRFWFNKHYSFGDLYIKNKAENQTGVGVRIFGPTSLSGNTAGGNTVWEQVVVEYFDKGVHLGDAESQLSGSEYTITHCAVSRCNIGWFLVGGNTENITFKQFLTSFNQYGLVTLSANNIHIIGGSSSHDNQVFDLGTVGVFSVRNFRAESFGTRVLRGSGNIHFSACTLTPGFGHTARASDFAFQLEGPSYFTLEDSCISGRLGLATLYEGHRSSLKLVNNRWYNDDLIDEPFAHIPGSGAMAISIWLQGNTLSKDSDRNYPLKTFDDGLGVNHAGFLPIYTPLIRIIRGPGYPQMTSPSLYLNNLKGLSSSVVESKNLTGSVTITGTDTQGLVCFTSQEADTNYNIILSQEADSGANIGLIWVKPQTKTVDGFTIELQYAPGTNKNVKVNWLIVR